MFVITAPQYGSIIEARPLLATPETPSASVASLDGLIDEFMNSILRHASGVLARLYLSPNTSYCMPDLFKEHNNIKVWTLLMLLEFSRFIASAACQANDPLYAVL
jgi:hypothetical protein